MNYINRLVRKLDVPEDGTCTICCSLMFGPKHDPKLFNPCKHLLCADCDKKVKDKCPICRSERRGPSSLQEELRNKIGLLNARCKGHGCFVEGKLCDLPKHESNCRYCQHCCQYCRGYFPDGMEHEIKCQFKCRYCHEKLLYKDSTPEEHERKCQKYPVCCLSNDVGCRKKVARSELERHVRTCPFYQIRDFLKLRQLQHQKITLQMLTVQKSEVQIRKEHLEVIVKHQKLLGKYQELFKEHVNLMEKMKTETTKKRDYLLLMKRNQITEAKYIKLSEQFILVGEMNKELTERILATDQQLRRDAIKSELSENRSKEFNRLLEEFHRHTKTQYKLQHVELLSFYKNLITSHEDQIKEQFETMLKKSETLFTALFEDGYHKDIGMVDAIKTLKDDDFNFLRQYQTLMANQINLVSALYSEFTEKHRGIHEKQLRKLSSFFGLRNTLSERDKISTDIREGSDLRDSEPQVFQSNNINHLEGEIKLVEDSRDRGKPITENVRQSALGQRASTIADPPKNLELEFGEEIEVSTTEKIKPTLNLNPALELDTNEFRLPLIPSAPKIIVDLNMLDVGIVPPEPFEEEKEPLSLQDMIFEEKEQVEEREPINLSLVYSDTLLEHSGDNQTTFTGSRILCLPNTRNDNEYHRPEGRFTPVDVGLGTRPVMLDPSVVARALQVESRRLLGTRREVNNQSEEVD